MCVGYHQPLSAVLDRATCDSAGLPIVRRRVGGGTTYLDNNQQFYQCIFHHKRLPFRVDEVYARLLGAPVAALRKLGLHADVRDGNEIEVDGRRIAGVGGGRIGEAVVVVGNILLDFDYEMMARLACSVGGLPPPRLPGHAAPYHNVMEQAPAACIRR